MIGRIKKNILEIGGSIILATVFFLITYFVMNWSVPVSAEKAKLQMFEAFRQNYWPDEESSMTDSVIMIDTHYDQKFVLEHEIGSSNLPIGQVAVADREKLLSCLEYLKKRNDYKYILLDIFLDEAVRQDSDSSLYNTIASMPRIVIANPRNLPISDTCLISKAGVVQYSIALWENDFVKYPFFYKEEKSMPLVMYEDIAKRTINEYWPFYVDGGLARNSVILTSENVDIRKRAYLGGVEDYLLEDFLEDEGTKGKYILIGDFVDDLHNTFLGEIPGTLINFYAYLALIHGKHRLSFGMILLFVLIFALPIYLKITKNRILKCIISYSKKLLPEKKKKEKKEKSSCKQIFGFLKIVISKICSSWVGYPLYLTFFCMFTYIIYNEAYDILITTSLYYLFNLVWDSYHEMKLKK